MKVAVVPLLAAAVLARAEVATTTEPPLSQIAETAASIKPVSPVSDVRGLAFDRFYQVWLENIDYNASAADPNMQWLASQGILLTNYHAVTHPSEPNYCAAASGDTFGMDNDDFKQIPANVSAVVDLLDSKGISWGEYQEHIPYPGFQGYNYSNQETYADDYIKSFSDFETDLSDKKLPQWAFLTPNMTNDAHDTNITFGAQWKRSFMSTLLKNDYFMHKTVVLLTFDEDSTYFKNNRVYSILVGGAIPDHLKGTTDDTFYTHYSTIASVSANWGLPSLGRWDCGANIFQLVANKTGYVNYKVDTTNLLLNETYPGPMSVGEYSKFSPIWPIRATNETCSAGHGVLDIVKNTYPNTNPTYNYTSPCPWDSSSNYNTKVSATRESATSSNATSSTSGTPSAQTGAAVAATVPGSTIVTGALVALCAYLI